MTQITSQPILVRSLLFAKLSQIAYLDVSEASKAARSLGFTTIEFYERDGAQAYRFQNKTDLVIACRGTQPTEFGDIKADLKAFPVLAETISRVHSGFKTEVDDLWPMICEDISRKANAKKMLWFCGHSLGAAMATIMASRCKHDDALSNPAMVFTYGSPKVGWSGYCKSLNVVHHRWKNNNDIVTTVPLTMMGYKHHGIEHYINAYGQVRNPTGWQRVKDKFRGMWMGIKEGKIDNFTDHSIDEYIKHIRDNQAVIK
jgi:triacylglycerol lipase|tara:strand:+ start:1004 stop:1777 length:774 start_codon:yes stop_codon:yes gene_type:complete